MPARRIAVSLALLSFAIFGQSPLDDASIVKLVKAGLGEQTIVAMIGQQPGTYALSPDEVIALKTSGVSDKILAAMIARNGAASGPSGEMVLHDGTPIRLRLTKELTFNFKPGDHVDFEVMDDLRIDGLLVLARGTRPTAIITQAEPKTRWGLGGKLGVSLDSLTLLNGTRVAFRLSKEAHAAGPAATPAGPTAAPAGPMTAPAAPMAAVVKPAETALLFSYGKDEVFPEGSGLSVYVDGAVKLEPSAFLVDIAFTSNPPGALVSMYGTAIGRTPFTTRLAPGAYKATFSAEGFYDLTRSIAVGPGHANAVYAAFELKP